MALEIEVKFALKDRETFVRRLVDAGAEQLYPETFEDNIILDRRGELRTKGALLRVRKFGRYVIATYKGAASIENGVKTREEVQTGVESLEKAISLFDALGFRPTFRYQKFREVWRLGSLEVVLDRTPIGEYFEIEGQLDEIRATVELLKLDMNDALRASYSDLYRQHRRTRGDLGENMVFPPQDFPSA